MPNVQQLLNDEIRRLARKEVNAVVKVLKAQMIEMRKTISEQNRRLKILEKLADVTAPAAASAAPAALPAADDSKAIRVTPERIAKWRAKLGLNKSQYAKLLGVNTMSVIHWESGQTAPRGTQKVRIAALRDMGKRELGKLMAEKGIALKRRRARRAAAKPEGAEKAADSAE